MDKSCGRSFRAISRATRFAAGCVRQVRTQNGRQPAPCAGRSISMRKLRYEGVAMNCLRTICMGLAAAAVLFAVPAMSQEGRGDVVYVPTPQIVVDEMLTMAKIGPNDFLIDLGSGDGRFVITAATKYGARGFGV